MEMRTTEYAWKVTNLTGSLEDLDVVCHDADEVAELVGSNGGPDTVIIKRVTTTIREIHEFTIGEFLGAKPEER